MSRQRILIITRNLPPLVGGMERFKKPLNNYLRSYHCVKNVLTIFRLNVL